MIYIGQNMWERGITELDALGIQPADWLHGWNRRIIFKDAVAFGPEGKPHAILGCDEEYHSPEVFNTSFQAAKSFELPGVGRQVTKEMRKAIPQLMRDRRIARIHVYSLCVVPEAEKWFRLLGLTEDTNYQGPQRGPFQLRRFTRSA